MLPADRLPCSAADRHAALRDYFCDKDASAKLTERGWELTLAWPGDVDRHVDPRLPIGLNWWGNGVSLADMALERRCSGLILSSLYDTWTLYSWSKWLAQKCDADVSSPVILHVDDHKDLGSPRLFIEGEGLRDPLTGEVFELANPESVQSAILSGAVGMGSFMTPFLHATPAAEVRHLCQPPKATRTRDFRIVQVEECDTLLDPSARRPAMQLQERAGVVGPGTYRVTADVQAWLSHIGPGPILIHIDMDYFNNRYDGDSDWRERKNQFDPPLQNILAKIDQLTEALMDFGLAPRIENIAIAFSPGFFPAEHWEQAGDRLVPAFEQLYAA